MITAIMTDVLLVSTSPPPYWTILQSAIVRSVTSEYVTKGMAHECDDCEETFETHSWLRFHECSDDESVRPSGDSVEARALTDELDDHLNRVAEGDVTAVHEAVAAFETALPDALDDALKTPRVRRAGRSSVMWSRRTTRLSGTMYRWRHRRLRTWSDDT